METDRYIFIGKNGSMGLRQLRIYRLHVYKRLDGGVLATRTFLGIEFWSCPYDSMELFEANWQRFQKAQV